MQFSIQISYEDGIFSNVYVIKHPVPALGVLVSWLACASKNLPAKKKSLIRTCPKTVMYFHLDFFYYMYMTKNCHECRSGKFLYGLQPLRQARMTCTPSVN